MILAILQARMSSTRLPGKVMLPILGVPALQQQIRRIQNSMLIDKLIVATSDDESDTVIADLCQKIDVACFRGPLDDVLDRFYQAAKTYEPLHIVRLTGDCPLCDSGIIDEVIQYHLDGDFDFTSNALPPTFPDGLDVEVIRYNLLEDAASNATTNRQREHVTPYIREQADTHVGNYTNSKDLSSLRWTLDYQDDYEFIIKVYEHLYKLNPEFNYTDIIKLIENNPEIQKINSSHIRNEATSMACQEVSE
jgi:spore coat polysaccharide biosynthesis protein SpsF